MYQAKIGDRVKVWWTNCNHQYSAKGVLSKINKKTYIVELTEEVYGDTVLNGHGVIYQIGQKIQVSIVGTEFNHMVAYQA